MATQQGDQTVDKAKTGIVAVLIGVVAIVATPVVIAVILGATGQKAADIQTLAGSAISAIATITAAYFGITLGQQGRADAEEKKDQAKDAAGSAKAEAAAARAVALAVGPAERVDVQKVESMIGAALRSSTEA